MTFDAGPIAASETSDVPVVGSVVPSPVSPVVAGSSEGAVDPPLTGGVVGGSVLFTGGVVGASVTGGSVGPTAGPSPM